MRKLVKVVFEEFEWEAGTPIKIREEANVPFSFGTLEAGAVYKIDEFNNTQDQCIDLETALVCLRGGYATPKSFVPKEVGAKATKDEIIAEMLSLDETLKKNELKAMKKDELEDLLKTMKDEDL